MKKVKNKLENSIADVLKTIGVLEKQLDTLEDEYDKVENRTDENKLSLLYETIGDFLDRSKEYVGILCEDTNINYNLGEIARDEAMVKIARKYGKE